MIDCQSITEILDQSQKLKDFDSMYEHTYSVAKTLGKKYDSLNKSELCELAHDVATSIVMNFLNDPEYKVESWFGLIKVLLKQYYREKFYAYNRCEELVDYTEIKSNSIQYNTNQIIDMNSAMKKALHDIRMILHTLPFQRNCKIIYERFIIFSLVFGDNILDVLDDIPQKFSRSCYSRIRSKLRYLRTQGLLIPINL